MSKSVKPLKRLPTAFISFVIMMLMLLMMFILVLVPNAGKNPKNPVLAIYGLEGNYPSLSLRNTLHAAGFEYVVLKYGEELPTGNTVVVMGVGPKALSVLEDHRDSGNVAGFILVCPEADERYLAGITGNDPSCDIAIFAGKDNSTNVASMGAARAIYERISGDDTLFGISIKRGGLFASKVFVNTSQNRTLSLSCFNVSDPSKLFFSPLFQNELAGYLSVTYIDEATRETSFGRINSWFVLSMIAIFLEIIGILMYLSTRKVSETGFDSKKAPVSRWVFGVIGGVSVAVAIGIIASTFIGMLHDSMIVILSILPAVFMICLFVINFSWITTKDGKIVPGKKTLIPSVMLAVIIGLFAVLAFDLVTDLSIHKIGDAGLASGLLILLLISDAVLSTGLIYASRKSSASGQGAKNCFGNRLIILLMFIPSVCAFLFGLIPGNSYVFYAGLSGIAATGIPYLAVMPLVKHTDRSLIPGVLHALVYVLVIAAVL